MRLRAPHVTASGNHHRLARLGTPCPLYDAARKQRRQGGRLLRRDAIANDHVQGFLLGTGLSPAQMPECPRCTSRSVTPQYPSIAARKHTA
jgi:hypothetical protein